MEVWQPVPGYEEYYEVSNTGRVRAIERVIGSRNRWGGITYRTYPMHECKQWFRDPRYGTVTLCRGGKNKTHFIHVLVAAAFIGPKPRRMQVCHNDGNSHNNTDTNLRYDTCKNNLADRHRHGTALVGSKGSASKLTEMQVEEMRRLYATEVCSQPKLGRLFGVSQTTVNSIILRKSWTHI